MAQFIKFSTIGGMGLLHKTWIFFLAVSIFHYPENFIIIPIAGIILIHNYEFDILLDLVQDKKIKIIKIFNDGTFKDGTIKYWINWKKL